MNLMNNMMMANQLGATNPFAAPSASPYITRSNPFAAPIPGINYNTPTYAPTYSTPTYAPAPAQKPPSNFGNYFNSVAGLVSQFLGSRGQYQTTQYTPGVGYATPPAAQIAQAQRPLTAPNPYEGWTPEQITADRQKSLGGGLGAGLDGILYWVTQNPMIVLGAGVGVYLLMKEPPRGRR